MKLYKILVIFCLHTTNLKEKRKICATQTNSIVNVLFAGYLYDNQMVINTVNL